MPDASEDGTSKKACQRVARAPRLSPVVETRDCSTVGLLPLVGVSCSTAPSSLIVMDSPTILIDPPARWVKDGKGKKKRKHVECMLACVDPPIQTLD